MYEVFKESVERMDGGDGENGGSWGAFSRGRLWGLRTGPFIKIRKGSILGCLGESRRFMSRLSGLLSFDVVPPSKKRSMVSEDNQM